MIWFVGAALLLHLAYWLLLGFGLSRVLGEEGDGEKPATADPPPISVVVSARDEEKHLDTLFAALDAQTHENFEAIIVDDGSIDRTAALVELRSEQDSRFRLVRVGDPKDPRKKHALTLGIQAASFERLAFTDADCEPGPGWLETIAAHAAESPDVVLVGFGPLRKRPGLLNAFARYETWTTALLTAATIGLGHPYMAVGRNFSYSKSLFDRVGGFEDHLHSLSGDDDLLVQQAHQLGAPVRYMMEEESFVESDAPANARAWFRQKLRHTSAGRFYDRTVQLLLTAFHASNLVVWLAPLVLGWTGAAFLAGRFLVQRLVLRRAADAFHLDPYLMLYQPFLDLGYLHYNTFVAPAGVFFGGRKW